MPCLFVADLLLWLLAVIVAIVMVVAVTVLVSAPVVVFVPVSVVGSAYLQTFVAVFLIAGTCVPAV